MLIKLRHRAASCAPPSSEAEWIWGALSELKAAGLLTLADEGYQGSTHAKTPTTATTSPGRRKRPTGLTRNSEHLAKGKRAAQDVTHPPQAALLPSCSPWRVSQLAKAIPRFAAR